MTRSRYHTPIQGVCGYKSCKAWRSGENRRYRAYVNNLMRHEQYDSIQGYCGKFGNEWDSPRDGKMYFGHMKNRPCGTVVYFISVYFTCREKNWGIDHYNCHKYYLELMRK
jgi:hypothetical protein